MNTGVGIGLLRLSLILLTSVKVSNSQESVLILNEAKYQILVYFLRNILSTHCLEFGAKPRLHTAITSGDVTGTCRGRIPLSCINIVIPGGLARHQSVRKKIMDLDASWFMLMVVTTDKLNYSNPMQKTKKTMELPKNRRAP